MATEMAACCVLFVAFEVLGTNGSKLKYMHMQDKANNSAKKNFLHVKASVLLGLVVFFPFQ